MSRSHSASPCGCNNCADEVSGGTSPKARGTAEADLTPDERQLVEIANSRPRPTDRIKPRSDPRHWCLHCRIGSHVATGRLGSSDASRLNTIVARYTGRESRRAPGSSDYDLTACSAEAFGRINEAVKHIQTYITNFPTSSQCVANFSAAADAAMVARGASRSGVWWQNLGDSISYGGSNTCFGGHTSDGPRKWLKKQLNSSNFHINCDTCGIFHEVAYTNAGQWDQDSVDIHICNELFSDSRFNAKGALACVIAHEVMHAGGMAEGAATANVQGWLTSNHPTHWNCP